MNFGIALPNIGPAAEPEIIFGLADAVEEFGLGSVWTGDHLAFPKNPRLPYPYARGGPGFIDSSSKVLDPLTVMAAVIGRTKRIKVGVSVLILPYRHPLVTAKQLGTMQVLSGGRVILGVGVGWIPEEFEALDVDYRKRGAMTDEQMRYFRAVWEHDDAEFEGAHYHIRPAILPMAAHAVATGGHVRIGLGDEPFTADGPSNGDLVARVASMAASIGREVASPREARDIMGLPQYEAGPVKEVAP